MSTEHCDVAIVGARCAGAPLATLLARAGVKVVLLDRAQLPSNTLSSHVKQADALVFLDKLGVIDDVRATGAPFMRGVDSRLEGFRFVADYPSRAGDVGGAVCVRRHILDAILQQAAARAGVEVRTQTKAVAMLREGGRVVGLRVASGGVESQVRARLVVGADGRSSTVAALCGARRYNVTPNDREYYWTYFENATMPDVPRFVFHRWGDRFVIAAPSDHGLMMVGVSPEVSDQREFRRDLEASLLDHARSCEPVAEALAGARRATKIFGIVRFDGYFREAAGRGWVLAGDAGHFKDPAAGRGIGDAFAQVDRLAPAIVDGLAGDDGELDRAMGAWAAWRDEEFAEHYWLGNDFGRAGAIPMTVAEIVKQLETRGRMGDFLDLLSHRARPSKVLTIARALEATGRLRPRARGARRELLVEAGTLAQREARQRWMNRHPVFAVS
jgi:flavin-dependent dehydrogenase